MITLSPKKTRKFATKKKTTTLEGKREYQSQWAREFRKHKKVKQKAKDQLTEDFKQAMNRFEETILENKMLKAAISEAQSIARDSSLTDKEKISAILTMPSHVVPIPSLKKIGKPRLEIKKK